MTASTFRRKVKASRTRNDNARWGFSPSILSRARHDRLVRDVASGRWGLTESALRVTMKIFGKAKKAAGF